MTGTDERLHRLPAMRSHLSLVFMGVGGVALVVAVLVQPADAAGAANQDWPPFVLVTGLLLIGLVADADGVFAAVGRWFAGTSARTGVQFTLAMTAVVIVTAVLNLDTAAAFLTPVLVYAARHRRTPVAPLLYGCLFLANASSLFLPGSNLTNLIVIGGRDMTGVQFASAMWAPALGAALVTGLVVVAIEWRSLSVRVGPQQDDSTAVSEVSSVGSVGWLGLASTVVAAIGVLVLREPAPLVLVVGLVAVTVRLAGGRIGWPGLREAVGVPTLLGLFGLAVVMGTVGRAWTGPAWLLARLDIWGTGAVGALAAVAFNNLPAASLLAGHPPVHPFALLIGLNIGPNGMATGSLAWLLWWRSAIGAGADPSLSRAVRMGAVAAVPALVVSLALLWATAR